MLLLFKFYPAKMKLNKKAAARLAIAMKTISISPSLPSLSSLHFLWNIRNVFSGVKPQQKLV